MVPVLLFLAVIVVVFAVVDNYNAKQKEAKGICKTTGGSCSSPTGCSCGDIIEPHEH